ncbi:MAG: ATP-dependent DNA helicase RecG [Candidatus Omnitrophica bacterium]|nr:ATP-dependent DNA helicase RecG [Candidatus Omnitrophota bacterium]
MTETAKDRLQQKNPPDARAGGLETPIQFCPGVGPQRARLFEKLNVQTVRDLFWHLPRAYEDYHHISPIRGLDVGKTVTVIGVVTAVEGRLPRGRGKVRHILNAQVKDATGYLSVVWFNQPYLQKQIKVGQRLLLHGKVDYFGPILQMSSPRHQEISAGDDQSDSPGVVPIYPLCEGLTQAVVCKVIRKALERFSGDCREFLPEALLKTNGFPARTEAFRILHNPQPGEGAPTQEAASLPEGAGSLEDAEASSAGLQCGDARLIWEKARKRLVFEEFFLHQLILRQYNGIRKQTPGVAHPKPDPDPWTPSKETLDLSNPRTWPAQFVRSLPFQLTQDQIQVCREIELDMQRPAPMSRLLQGDVGSGKTVVSLYAMIVAVSGGAQAALMAPTEILAQQHANTIRKLTQSLPGLNAAVLRGGAKAKERRLNQDLIRTGAAQIVIGTHALFQGQVEFKNLGLVVVDEQHKFGVNQRQQLIEKGIHPDLLAATATPIPRTLSLTLFGDMECSVIKSLPPGRPPVITRWTTWGKEKKVWEFVDGLIAQGQQVYVVCPIIEPSETAPHLPSTEAAFERLSQTFFPHRRVAVLHGRHSAEMKEDFMMRMQAGQIDVVVATTVIEVGVDLPNATVMVVLGAERFGLAQLHQLRGRIGRGTQKSYCVLITHPNIAPYAVKRMRVMEKTNDGFLIADEDLRLRGAGEQFGTRQSGHINFRLADPLRDGQLLREANQAASQLYRADPRLKNPEHQTMKQELKLTFHRMEAFRPS